MSEQSVDVLPEYWNEMLKLHWEFIEEDESPSKLERKSILESSILKFLSIVPNERKFFLPETEYVLRKSITEMENFSAHNAIKGFESISQYANNLCKRPWRKEYKTIKTYSGYYHHEVEKNLVSAEHLFIAMGYIKYLDGKFVLNEPICPDQVANVSRDCMIAYVECEFMKKLKAHMEGLNLPITWNDIYINRRHTVCDLQSSVAFLTKYLLKKEEISENIYATIKHNQDGHLNNMVSNCIKCANPLDYIHSNGCAIRRGMQPVPLPPMGTQCSIHMDYNFCQAYSTASQKIPHSKSLEHYNHESCAQYQIPHRHSLDLPNHYETSKINKSHIYERPYDFVDGNFRNTAIFQHKNNFHSPGNRNPLPIMFTNKYFPPSSSPPSKVSLDVYCNHNGFSSRGNKEFTIEQKNYPPISAEQQFNEFSSSYKKQQAQASQHFQDTNRSSGHHNNNSNFNSTEINDVKHLINSQTQSSQKSQQKKINKGYDNNYKYSGSYIIPTSASDSYEEMPEKKKRSASRTRNEEGVGYFGNWDYVYQSLGNDKNIKSNNSLQPQPVAPNHQSKEKKNINIDKSNPTANTGKTAKGSLWTCSFCTFLNKDKAVICEICSKTKKLGSTDSFNKPTCV